MSIQLQDQITEWPGAVGGSAQEPRELVLEPGLLLKRVLAAI